MKTIKKWNDFKDLNEKSSNNDNEKRTSDDEKMTFETPSHEEITEIFDELMKNAPDA